MSVIIKPDNAVDCEGCIHLKYESDTDAYVCISKKGCIKKEKEAIDPFDYKQEPSRFNFNKGKR